MGIFRWFFGLFRKKGSSWSGFDAVTDIKVDKPDIFDRQNL